MSRIRFVLVSLIAFVGYASAQADGRVGVFCVQNDTGSDLKVVYSWKVTCPSGQNRTALVPDGATVAISTSPWGIESKLFLCVERSLIPLRTEPIAISSYAGDTAVSCKKKAVYTAILGMEDETVGYKAQFVDSNDSEL